MNRDPVGGRFWGAEKQRWRNQQRAHLFLQWEGVSEPRAPPPNKPSPNCEWGSCFAFWGASVTPSCSSPWSAGTLSGNSTKDAPTPSPTKQEALNRLQLLRRGAEIQKKPRGLWGCPTAVAAFFFLFFRFFSFFCLFWSFVCVFLNKGAGRKRRHKGLYRAEQVAPWRRGAGHCQPHHRSLSRGAAPSCPRGRPKRGPPPGPPQRLGSPHGSPSPRRACGEHPRGGAWRP